MKAYTKLISLIKHFEQKHLNMTLFIGIVVGVGIGMYLFSWLVPDSAQLIRMYDQDRFFGKDGRGACAMMRYGHDSPFRASPVYQATATATTTVK